MWSRTLAIASSDTRVESVRMYVIRPTEPLARDLHPLIELLGDLHRALHGKPRRLLQLARDERRRRVALALLLGHRLDDVRRLLQVGHHGLRFRLLAELDGPLPLLHQPGIELRRKAGRQTRRDVPVLLHLEGVDGRLAVADELQGDGLHPARAQPPLHLVPQERAQLVADQPVEHPPGLLGVDHALIDLPDAVQRGRHGGPRDLVEHEAADLLLGSHLAHQMPADRFAFSIRVGRDEDPAHAPGGVLQLLDDLLARRNRLVRG